MKTIVVIALLMAGCVSAPQKAPFERCVDAVGHSASYETDKLKVADWCATHNNGGIN